MSWLSKLFSSSGEDTNATTASPIVVDMHSHLLPRLDDGSKSDEETLDLIRSFIDMGYQKLIMTPHIMGDFFKNTPENILDKLEHIRSLCKSNNLNIHLDAAAEYYLDEWFVEKLERGDKMLTFGKNYLLVETSYMNEPARLNDTLFAIKSNGFRPILAHPERYLYLYSNFDLFKKIYEKEIFFQININSLSGYYSKPAKTFAEKLIDNNMVDFIGSDCHGERHIEALKKARATKHYKKILSSPKILNNTLL